MAKKRAVKGNEKKCTHCHSRLSWLVWGIVAILVVLVLIWLLSLPSVGLSGNAALQTVAYMPKDSTLNFEVKIDGLKEMTVTFSETVKNLVIKVDEISKPSWEFEGAFLSGFKAESADADKISNVKFLLKIEEEDFKPAGLNLGEVTFYNAQGEIEWKLIKKDGGYRYYEVESTELGEFMIGRAAIEAAPKTPEETITPGPEVSEEKPVEDMPAEEEPVETAQPAPVKEKGFFGRAWERITNLFS